MPRSQPIAGSSVVYVSEAACPFNDQLVGELARAAAANNASIGVTGYLHFSKGRFVQCLEGDRRVVGDLLDRIDRDSRHAMLVTAWRPGRAERRFPRWSMRWVRESEITEIGLEHVLADQLLLNARVGIRDASLERLIWRLIDSVADKLHNQRG